MAWDVAEFNQVPEDGWPTGKLIAFAKDRWWCDQISVPCPRTLLPDTFEQLLTQLPPRFRTAIRSARRRLQQQYSVDFGLHDNSSDLPDALDALYANHASRWRAKGMPGVFADEQKRRFYEVLASRLLERGWLRFFYLSLDGRRVAQEFCFEYKGVVMLLQEGFDYSLARENIGNALRSMVFEYLIERKVYVYDFLAGESRHKRTWCNGVLNDLRITCVRKGSYGYALRTLPRLCDSVKSSLRHLRDACLKGRQNSKNGSEQRVSTED
jgi:CelD/BcsL family acetyltransferase involved in cellulose biosynthesis